MEINVLTIFPEVFEKALNFSILKRAREKQKVNFKVVNIRDFAEDKHKMTDDTPFGGEGGMVMKVEPIHKALKSVKEEGKTGKVLLMSASGRSLTQEKLREYALLDSLTIICGRYEGVDERVVNYVDEEICIGDYILSGGEFASLVIIEGVTRLLPEVLGNEESAVHESFEKGILDFPQYTKPREYEGMQVPIELVSGNHEMIKKFRRQQALLKTKKNRPELLEKIKLSDEDRKFLKG
ncbi:MAG: tRNA (guanosine(37)-N1)-methyltransferase TrmD [Candidatus Goldiibacteriota bacterium HGW-Goldbacteria-1]|nr:MAG: tRNA (guanosine(37)-N1)-methyltransferase TrmD [Candidatus Goldiibacteriota bacterium HGW-Goldbacteria-1]